MASRQASQLYGRKTDFLRKSWKTANRKKSEAEDMTAYVKNTKTSLKLQMLDLQNQLDTIEAISEIPDEDKMEYLFWYMDKDSNSLISVSELSDAIRKVDAGISFQESLEEAIHSIALIDTNNDARLNIDEFKVYMKQLTENAGVTSQEISEYFLMNVIYSTSGNTWREEAMLTLKGDDIEEKVKKLSKYYDVYNNVHMKQLYELFDDDDDGTISFEEVALGFYKIKGNMSEATKLAMELVLMTDEDDNRRIDYNEFVRLIMHVCALEGEKSEDLIPDFIIAMYFERDTNLKDRSIFMIANEDYNVYQDEKDSLNEAASIMDALKYSKTQKLFELWDTNNNELISWEELAIGCRKFQQTIGMDINSTLWLTKQVMHMFDEDFNRSLDKREFARFLVKFAEMNNVDLHGLIDTLAILSLVQETSKDEENYIRALASEHLDTIEEEDTEEKDTAEEDKNDESTKITSGIISFKIFKNGDPEEAVW
eukprot:CAMPEP_0194141918 /NCGR_PEP_ID=MMETSP0152-20130528/11272_1 /TAXON_ID=1049557 /ORGANISM="Thalassiothrix antarctica, Strain L6-D1" /LENGTH=482 /DNA_ID=CAMNT_0038840693 /DNA_START=52 /DNA_END=1497 /DNA_ORIENTATION=-